LNESHHDTQSRSWQARRLAGWVFGLALLLAALACTGLRLTPSADEAALVAGHGVNRQQALVLLGAQPRTLDPATTLSGAGGPVGAIFSGLVSLDTDLQVQPELAAGWQVDPTGTVYTFYLRPQATFHDGRPVTAADVIFSWERAADPQTESDTVLTYLGDIIGVADKRAGRAVRITGLRANGDHVLEVHIDAPKVYFLSKLTYPVAYVVDERNVARPAWERAPNGTGPFTLQKWLDDEILILARYAGYYSRPAQVENIVYYLGAGLPLTLYENGQIDLVGIDGGTLERALDPNSPLYADLHVGVNLCTFYINFNLRQPPFDDPAIRRAFSLALDRRRLVEGLYQGNALPAVGPLPPGMPGYGGEIEPHDYDPQRARELMAGAGFAGPADLPTLTYTTAGYGGVGALVTAVITMWQDTLGVAIEPELIDPFIYLDELYAGNVGHFFSSGWCADYPDPENFLDVLFHSASNQNLSGYASPEVDALLEEARVEPDVTRRLALYAEAERRIVADAPVLFLVHSLSAELVKPYLVGYKLTPMEVPQWHRVGLAR
jgi:oligopeptide transport system substrate-binding protein